MSMSATATPPYVELHCHSAYSFLDGASLPEELACRAGELGHTALGLTDHNSLSGSMELAQVAADYGVRAIHGAEIDLAVGGERGRCSGTTAGARAGEDDTRHLTLLVRDERGWSNLCRIITHAHAHTREGTGRVAGEPSIGLEAVIDHAEGLVCLTGCAARSAIGRGGCEEHVARRLLEAFGPENLCVELQRPYARDDRARNRRLAGLARSLGVRCVASGDVHAHARSRAELQDAFVALRHHTTLDASEPLRRGNHSHVMSTPEAMARRFADHPEAVRETLLLAERLTFDLTRDLGYRYPGAEDEDALRRLAELCAARLQERYDAPGPGGGPPLWSRRGSRRALASRRLRPGRGAAGAGAEGDRAARAGGVLPAPPRYARARPRGRARGPGARLGAGAAGARARPRLLGLLDRLLPDRALAHRPDRERARARALPARGPPRPARHRPRLPPRHPRAADPPYARALRQRACGARRRLSDLPRAGGDPRAGQGARAARRGDRAVARGAERHGPGSSTTSPLAAAPRMPRPPGDPLPGRAARIAGAGWRGWWTRPMACRATCPSTLAG